MKDEILSLLMGVVDEPVAFINTNYLRGVYRTMVSEWLQAQGFSNTYQVSSRKWLEIPASIDQMRSLCIEVVGESEAAAWMRDICEQYNEGRRV